MKKFLSVLGKIFGLGAPLLTTFVKVPGIDQLVMAITNTVISVEASIGDGKGSDKKQLVLNLLRANLGPVVQSIEATSKARLADEALFLSGSDKIAQGTVDILNSFQHPPEPPIAG